MRYFAGTEHIVSIKPQANQSVITQRMLNNTPFSLGVFYCKLRFYVPYRLNSPALLLTLQVQLSGKKRKTVDAKTQQRNLFHILLANIFFFQNVSSKITRNPPYLTCHTLSERWKLATFLGEILEKIRQALLRFSQTCEFWSSKANWRLHFSLPSIILTNLLGNKTLL